MWQEHYYRWLKKIIRKFTFFKYSFFEREVLKCFWLAIMLVILEITISLVSTKNPLYQCHPPFTKRVSSHRVQYLEFPSTCNICVIYLHVIEACLKVTIAMFYFCHLKNTSGIMKTIFNSISIYSWKKNSLLTNIRNKRVIREINFIFLMPWKMAKVFLQKFVIFNMKKDSFLAEKWETLECTGRYV